MCPGCGRLHWITLGGGIDFEGNAFSMENWCCRPCGRLFALASTETEGSAPTCFGCGRRVTPWPGEGGIIDGHGPVRGGLRILGPCPACGRQMSERDWTLAFCLWD